MKNRVRLLTALFLLYIAHPAVSAEVAPHPLVSLYPGAEITDSRSVDYGEARIYVTSPDAPTTKAPPWLRLLGDIRNDEIKVEGVSTLQLYKNYQDAFEKAGFEVVFECELEACGGNDQVQTYGGAVAVNGDVYHYYQEPYYLVVAKPGEHGPITVAQFFGGAEGKVVIQQLIVEQEPLQTGLVKVDARYVRDRSGEAEQVAAAGRLQAGDHPLLPRYPGAELEYTQRTDFAPVHLPLIKAGEVTSLELKGDLHRNTYKLSNVSTLKVIANYRSALDAAGFNLLSECESSNCGDKNQVKQLGKSVAVHGVYNFYHDPHYLVAQKGNVYIGLFAGGSENEVALQQTVVEVEDLNTGLVEISLDALKSQIESAGKALIYGIYFDTGKADVKSPSKPTLEVIAQFLSENADVSLYVVGHTDDTGELASNLQLSKARAQAVVDVLVRDYRIDGTRLIAQGVGPFAPADSNGTELGRGKNRRVELVKRVIP